MDIDIRASSPNDAIRAIVRMGMVLGALLFRAANLLGNPSLGEDDEEADRAMGGGPSTFAGSHLEEGAA